MGDRAGERTAVMGGGRPAKCKATAVKTATKTADKTAVFVISMVMCVIAGGYIMFALFFIIVPGLEDKDDYIMGALRLYIEIARLFFWLMQLLGERR